MSKLVYNILQVLHQYHSSSDICLAAVNTVSMALTRSNSISTAWSIASLDGGCIALATNGLIAPSFNSCPHLHITVVSLTFQFCDLELRPGSARFLTKDNCSRLFHKLWKLTATQPLHRPRAVSYKLTENNYNHFMHTWLIVSRNNIISPFKKQTS